MFLLPISCRNISEGRVFLPTKASSWRRPSDLSYAPKLVARLSLLPLPARLAATATPPQVVVGSMANTLRNKVLKPLGGGTAPSL
jgi:hypothetical protein